MSETTLTWDDLISQDPGLDFRRICGCWPQLRGKIMSIGISAFGDAFFAKPDDSVWKLDVFTGKTEQVAGTQAEFGVNMNTPAWQENHLRSLLVFELKERGLSRNLAQVFAPVPHPIHAGAINLERVQVLDAVVWHSIASQSLAQSGASAQPTESNKPWWKVW